MDGCCLHCISVHYDLPHRLPDDARVMTTTIFFIAVSLFLAGILIAGSELSPFWK
jgi:hypothetical protein